MNDAFTQSIAREVAQLLVQNQSTLQPFNSDSVQSQQATITPQRVLEVMQGNSQWLQQFESQLELSFQSLADRALDYWLQNTDKEIRDSLKALAEIAQLLQQDNAQSLAQNSSDAGESKFNQSVGKLSGNLTSSLLDLLFDKRSVSENETERSNQEAEHYRQSRGQSQAEISALLSRGERYN